MPKKKIPEDFKMLKIHSAEKKKIEEDVRIKDFAIASSINGIAIGDLEGVVTYVNRAALDMWGSDDPSEILGRPATVFAESEEEAIGILKTVLERGEWTGEITGKRKDGSNITVLLSASLVHDDELEPVCLMCSFVDITDRKRMEEDLRIRDSAIASAMYGIGIGDLEGNIVYVNDAALRMWGADDPAEIIGKSALEFALSEEEASRVFEEFIEKGSWSGEITGRKKDGTPITVLLSANKVFNEQGEPVCSMDSFVDISERKHMEEQLRIKDFAISSSINGIAIGDLQGNITYANDAFLHMWREDIRQEVIGRPIVRYAQSEEEAQNILTRIHNQGNWQGDITGKTKDGTPVTLQLSANMVADGNNNPVCLMFSFVDITERREIEEELRVMNSAIASSIDGIGIADLNGNITYVNDAALKMWGADDPAEVLGRSALELAQSEEEAIGIYRKILEAGSWVGEVSGFRKDGSPITLLLSASLVKNEKGEPVCMMDSFVDITDRKRMEEELRIKDFAIASSINPITLTDTEGKTTYANDAALKMIGARNMAEVIGHSSTEIARSREEAQEIREAVLEKGSWSGEISGYRLDGTPITVDLSSNIVRNEQGEPLCGMNYFIDITQRKQMEEELQIKNFAIASSINGIAIGDLDGNITYVNEAFLRLWGGKKISEVLGQSALSFARSKEEALKIFEAVYEKGTWFGELIATKKTGAPLVVQLSANMVTNDNGTPICLMCSFVDITEKKITEQKLQKAYESLEQRVEERTGELVRANIRLKKEVEERKAVQESLLAKEEELNIKSLSLEEANTALKVLLKRGEQDKNELEEKVLSNIKELALPYLEKLKSTALDEKQSMYVQILESNLNDIVSPFLQKLSSQYLNLTPTEIQVANLVREGKSTKEIAGLLHISKRAIEFHRNNLRNKLGLKKAKTNLRSYLLSLS